MLSRKTKPKENSNTEQFLDNKSKTEQYIYYDSNHLQKRSELNVIYCNDPSIKVIVFIDFADSTINYLSMKIAEQMEVYQNFNNLKGLKAFNILKPNDKTPIPLDGTLSNYFVPGDTLYCDLQTQEFWIKCKMNIATNLNNAKTSLSFDMRVPLGTKLHKFRLMVIKFACSFFTESILQSDEFYFFLSKSRVKILKTSKKDFLKICIEDFKDDSFSVSDAFDFNSEVSVFLQFNALEQLLFEEIKSQMTNSDYAFYWSEMRSYDFSDFIKNEKFAIVMKLIRKYVQKFSKLVNIVNTLTEHKLKNFYLFKPQILEESHMEDDDSSSVFNSGPTKANIILIHADIREKLSKPTEEEDKSDDSSNDEEEFDFKVLPSLESSTPSFLLEKTEPKKKKTKYIRKSTEFIRHRKSKRGSVSIRNIQGDLKSAFKRINFYEAVDLDSNIKEEKGCLEKIVIPGFKNLEYHIDEKLIDENSIRTNDDGSKEENQEIRKFNMHLLWVIFIMMVVFIFVTLIITLVFD